MVVFIYVGLLFMYVVTCGFFHLFVLGFVVVVLGCVRLFVFCLGVWVFFVCVLCCCWGFVFVVFVDFVRVFWLLSLMLFVFFLLLFLGVCSRFVFVVVDPGILFTLLWWWFVCRNSSSDQYYTLHTVKSHVQVHVHVGPVMFPTQI